MDVAAAISEYGFPIVSAVGLLYMIYFIWNFITNNIKAKLAEANVTLIALIDRIRMSVSYTHLTLPTKRIV